MSRWFTIARLRLALLLLALLALVGYVAAHAQGFARLLDIPPLVILQLAGLYLVTALLNAVGLHLIWRPFGLVLGLRESAALAWLIVYTKQFLPGGGLAYHATHLAERHAIPFSRVLGLHGASFLLALASGCGLGLALAISGAGGGGLLPFDPAPWFAAGALAGSLGLLAVALTPCTWAGRRADRLREVQDGARRLLSAPRWCLPYILVLVLNLLLLALRYLVCARALEMPLGPSDAIFLTVAAITAARLSMIPGGLGVNEGVAGLMARACRFPLETGVKLATLDRAISLACILILGLLGWAHLRGRSDRRG